MSTVLSFDVPSHRYDYTLPALTADTDALRVIHTVHSDLEHELRFEIDTHSPGDPAFGPDSLNHVRVSLAVSKADILQTQPAQAQTWANGVQWDLTSMGPGSTHSFVLLYKPTAFASRRVVCTLAAAEVTRPIKLELDVQDLA
ncbi:MAG: hypothetical protein ACT4PU_11425 [Planctomycetota bacterium]